MRKHFLLIGLVGFCGCLDNQGPPVTNTSVVSAAGAGRATTVSGGPSTQFSLVNAAVAQPTSGGSGSDTTTPSTSSTTNTAKPPLATLFFNANQTTTLNDVCQVQSSSSQNTNASRGCKCHFAWNETNNSDASTITRTVGTPLSLVTNFEVQCSVPDVFTNEIPDGTTIKISVVPDALGGSSANFSTTVLNFVKQSNIATGDFRDSEGHSFKNIFHYVCFDKIQQSLTIDHVKKATGAINPTSKVAISLSVANNFSIGQGSSPNTFSGQSYYYDFYVRSNEVGSINATNATFTCPQVNIGGTPSFFPLDSQFAIALNSNKDFSVPVQSRIVIGAAAGNSSQSSTILGFAAKPNSDGTCPPFTDAFGKVRRTFRLRQFSAVYPIRYDAIGEIVDQSQPFNVVYIMDRPVDKTGQDPFRPITRYGPKPCPFSFKTAQFGQRCSTDATLAGWNVNGSQIDGQAGCPIYPPIKDKWLKTDGTLVIRPFKPFLPHYIENTNFKACAFPSSTPIDPEIVLSHDDNIFPNPPGPNDFYCARYYPAPGAVVPPALGDPFDKTPGGCDLSNNATAVKTDRTYSCAKTFDPTNGSRITPAAGCCQICSGADCIAQGGGTLAAGRNLAFSPPQNTGNPPQAIRLVPRATPNQAGGSGCFDPSED